MKIIEAMKQVKELERKADDLVEKVRTYCAYLSYETPTYPNQEQQISEWVQANSDILKEVLRLKVAIQRTNLATKVTIDLGGKNITKSIAEWVIRRRLLATKEAKMWSSLHDRGLKDGRGTNTAGQPVDVKVIRCFDPRLRDEMVYLFQSEPTLIDAKLEVVNAITDLIE